MSHVNFANLKIPHSLEISWNFEARKFFWNFEVRNLFENLRWKILFMNSLQSYILFSCILLNNVCLLRHIRRSIGVEIFPAPSVLNLRWTVFCWILSILDYLCFYLLYNAIKWKKKVEDESLPLSAIVQAVGFPTQT